MVRRFQTWINGSIVFKNAAVGFAFLCCGLLLVAVGLHWSGVTSRPDPPSTRFGWAGKELADQENERLAASFPRFAIRGDKHADPKQRVCLHDAAWVVANGDRPAFRQLIGDCVGAGAKRAIESLQIVTIAMSGEGEFKPVYLPYHYACGRNAPEAGAGQLKRDPDGSLGAWQAKALTIYGYLPEDLPGLEPYSRDVVRRWAVKMPSAEWIAEGKRHLIGAASRVKTLDEARDAICNGYPVTIASDWGGFDRLPIVHGRLLNRRGPEPWPHQMCLIGYDGAPETVELFGEPLWLIANSWGDIHGIPTDGTPPGTFWIKSRDMKVILADDCWAYSDLDVFLDRDWDVIRVACRRLGVPIRGQFVELGKSQEVGLSL